MVISHSYVSSQEGNCFIPCQDAQVLQSTAGQGSNGLPFCTDEHCPKSLQ